MTFFHRSFFVKKPTDKAFHFHIKSNYPMLKIFAYFLLWPFLRGFNQNIGRNSVDDVLGIISNIPNYDKESCK